MLSTSFPSDNYREEIAQVESLAVTWRRQRRLIASPEALRSYEEDFLVRMAYNSNAIEGSTLTLAETEIIYEGEFVPGKPGREQIAARGIFEGHDFLARYSTDKRPFDRPHPGHSRALRSRPSTRCPRHLPQRTGHHTSVANHSRLPFAHPRGNG